MRTKLLAIAAAIALAFLLVTNPVVVEAAGQLTGADIKNNSLTGKDVKDGSLQSGDFQAGQLPAGPQGPKGAQGPAGQNGTNGTNGAPGTNGTNGTNGTPGTNGTDGTPGLQGVVRINKFSGYIGSTQTLTTAYSFLGQTVSVPITNTDQVIVADASAAVGVSTGIPTVALDVCIQPLAGGALTSVNGSGSPQVELGAQRIAYPVGGTVRPAVGTYSVGACAKAVDPGSVTVNDNDYASGWVAVVNAPASGGSS